jgi:ABC-type multidrug transport system ATPase subunit
VSRDGQVEVVDLGSRNGTRVGGRNVDRAALTAGTEVGIGPYRLVFGGASLEALDQHGALRLRAQGVELEIRGKRILSPTDLTFEPGELVAFIGESGAGKSTLLKALAGVHRPTGGRVVVNDDPLESRLTDIGYVPQDDIVHPLLTVREALGYAARLRLPSDARPDEIHGAVERAVGELGLDEHADTRVGSLSGGQRKRTGVAAELLSRPSLVFLDEPTTGLDPGLETRMMVLLRELADRRRTIVLVTHATKNLALCDRVVVMGRGGLMAFEGTPADALAFFGADDYDGIYEALTESPAAEWQERFRASRTRVPDEPPAPPHSVAGPARGPFLSQLRVLVGRYVRLLSRDRRNLALLVGQAPILGFLNAALFSSGLFHRGPNAHPGEVIQLLYLATVIAIWMGAVASSREVIKERTVFERESAIGVGLPAYVLSKLVVLGGVVALQVILYVAVAFALQPLHEPVGAYVQVVVLLFACGFVAACMGLLVSAAVSSEDQSMSLIPLVIIPQLLFAGTIVSYERMAEPIRSVSRIFFSQWGLRGVGQAAHVNGRITESPGFGRISGYGTHFFNLSLGATLLALAVFALVFLAGLTALLRRR